ncbi:MAG: iron export ABC transporter permease subunit FetB [Firmicutes bacterium]|nr:iron export ABC transporter permease subunit FetB [Bacillota bacterium]
MHTSYIKIDEISLACSLIFMVIAIVFSYIEKTKLEKELMIATVRCFFQLMAVGYVLRAVFKSDKWYFVVILVVTMITVAGFDAARREKKTPGAFLIAVVSITAGSIIVMGIIASLILKVDCWYNPQYIVPIMGMLIGNSMNGASILFNRLYSEIKSNRDKIEARLSLGATPKQALGESVAAAIKAAMIPVINNTMVVGIVSLPGMMTGQIIAGADPADSVRYQIVIMYMLPAAVSITTWISARMAGNRFFTEAMQLREM